MDKITDEKLKKYIALTEKALKKASKTKGKEAGKLLEIANCYYNDALYFLSKKDKVNSFAAINYAHAFLDAGAILKIFKVKDSKLFMVE
jgi:hypothetical protein